MLIEQLDKPTKAIPQSVQEKQDLKTKNNRYDRNIWKKWRLKNGYSAKQ